MRAMVQQWCKCVEVRRGRAVHHGRRHHFCIRTEHSRAIQACNGATRTKRPRGMQWKPSRCQKWLRAGVKSNTPAETSVSRAIRRPRPRIHLDIYSTAPTWELSSGQVIISGRYDIHPLPLAPPLRWRCHGELAVRAQLARVGTRAAWPLHLVRKCTLCACTCQLCGNCGRLPRHVGLQMGGLTLCFNYSAEDR